MADKHLTSISTKIFDAIYDKATDRDGLSAGDRDGIKQFGRSKEESKKIGIALNAFNDLIIDKGERKKLVHLLNLNTDAQSRLAGIVGHNGMGLLRQQFINSPGVAHAKLHDPKASAKVRAAAARHIGRSNDPLAKSVLTNALKTERDWPVRFAIAKALIAADSRMRKRPDVITILVMAYRKGDAGVRSYALSKLRDVRTRAVTDIFIDASTHRNPVIRRRSIRILAKLADPKAKAALLKALKDTDEWVRAAVPRSLKAEVARAQTLLDLLKLPKMKPANRAYILKQLSSFKEPMARLVVAELIKILNHDDKQVYQTAALILSQFEGKAVIDAFASVQNHGNSMLRIIALEYLGKRGDSRAVPGLIRLLKDSDSAIRMRAIQALPTKEKRVVDALIAAAKDLNKDVRISALQFLGALKDKRTVLALIKVLKNDSSWRGRMLAAQALGNIKSTKVVSALITALKKDSSSNVRGEAAFALGKIKDKRSLPVLITTLKKDSNHSVCEQAAGALRKYKDKRIVPALITVLDNNSHSYKRIIAAWLLGELKDKRAVPSLVKILKHNSESSLRAHAIGALEKIKDKRAVPALISIIKNSLVPFLCKGAAQALCTIKDKRIASALIRILKHNSDWHARMLAAQVLGEIKDIKTMPALKQACSDPHEDVRKAAALALKRFKN